MRRRKDTLLYLVRHGETDWNRERRLQGIFDIPLNDVGVAEAHQLAGHFAARSIACVVCSPLVRASATAGILADACACRLQIDSRLREIDHGSWSGLTLSDICRRFPSLVENEQLRPEAFDVSGGERLPDVCRRVSGVLADLLSQYDERSVLVVGHGVTLALMSCAASGLDLVRYPDHLPRNAGGVVLTFSGGQLIDVQPMRFVKAAMRQEVSR
jgi:broad specificity phosphatase PhoE